MRNPTFYHASPMKFSKVDLRFAPFGLHVGTIQQAVTVGARGKHLHEVEFTPRNALRLRDILHWDYVETVVKELRHAGVWTNTDQRKFDDRLNELRNKPLAEMLEDENLGGMLEFLREQLLQKGYDSIVYLNRYEGFKTGVPNLPTEVSDKDFLAEYPEARDSYIILDIDSAVIR